MQTTTVVGKALVFDDIPGHYGEVLGGGADIGHWLAHVAVRDLTFAGLGGNRWRA